MSVCGEIAGDAAGALGLLGRGVDALSMRPAGFWRVKLAIRTFTLKRARALGDTVGREVRRTRLGDREPDTVTGNGHKQTLVPLTGRKSRLAWFAKVPNKGAEGIKRAVLKLLEPLAERVHTVTSDNEEEFAHHESSAKALSAPTYSGTLSIAETATPAHIQWSPGRDKGNSKRLQIKSTSTLCSRRSSTRGIMPCARPVSSTPAPATTAPSTVTRIAGSNFSPMCLTVMW